MEFPKTEFLVQEYATEGVHLKRNVQSYALWLPARIHFCLTWLSIHLKPTAAEHSFLEALVNRSIL